jgi:hypothetical protein
MFFQVPEPALVLRHRDLFRVTDLPTSSTESAIGGADRADQEESTIRVPMGDVRDWAIGIFSQAVQHTVYHLEFGEVGHILSPNRITRLLDQVDHRRRNPKLEVVYGLLQPIEFGEFISSKPVNQLSERGEASFA